MTRPGLSSLTLVVALCARRALGNVPCIGKDPHTGSSVLDEAQCGAWQDIYDSTHGPSWVHCRDLRDDPCACSAVNCTDFSGKGCGINVTCSGDSITSIHLNYFVPARDALTAGKVDVATKTVQSDYGKYTLVASVKYTDPKIASRSLLEVHSGNGLIGPLPDSIGNLTKLTALNLGSNKINGTLPATLTQLTALEVFNVTGAVLTGPAPPLDYPSIWRSCSLGGTGNSYCSPLPEGAGWCNAHGRVAKTGACAPTPAPPTPAATMYSCNATVGQCQIDPEGTASAADCIASCKCVIPHNCGQFNNTILCNQQVTGCNVCDACCFDFVADQHSCDGCFNTPVDTPTHGGCGGK